MTNHQQIGTNLSRLAREIAMDILPVDKIQELHKLSDADWTKIQENPQFISMLTEMIAQWNSAGNTSNRVRVKAATGVEAMLEVLVADIADRTIPLNQRTEAMKMIARLGELDGQRGVDPAGGGGADRVVIQINMGSPDKTVTIDAQPNREAIDVG